MAREQKRMVVMNRGVMAGIMFCYKTDGPIIGTGGVFLDIFDGVCRLFLQILTLFQT